MSLIPDAGKVAYGKEPTWEWVNSTRWDELQRAATQRVLENTLSTEAVLSFVQYTLLSKTVEIMSVGMQCMTVGKIFNTAWSFFTSIGLVRKNEGGALPPINLGIENCKNTRVGENIIDPISMKEIPLNVRFHPKYTLFNNCYYHSVSLLVHAFTHDSIEKMTDPRTYDVLKEGEREILFGFLERYFSISERDFTALWNHKYCSPSALRTRFLQFHPNLFSLIKSHVNETPDDAEQLDLLSQFCDPDCDIFVELYEPKIVEAVANFLGGNVDPIAEIRIGFQSPPA